MPTVRKYDKDLGKWISVASSDATEINTYNPLLTGGKEELSVEEVLENDRKDIEILKKNVSWLALHGGGGYGGGGGGGVSSTATVNIIDPFDGSDYVSQIIWANTIDCIKYKVQSRGTSTYTVTIRLNGNVIQTDYNVSKNTIKYIYPSTLNIKKKSTLKITAVDDAANEYTAECSILVSTITLTAERSDMQVTPEMLNINSTSIPLKISANIPGRYHLYYSTKQIIYYQGDFYESGNTGEGQSLEAQKKYVVLDNLDQEIIYQISLKSPGGEDSTSPPIIPNPIVGKTYTANFRIAKEDNKSLFSSSASTTVSVVSATGLTIIPLVGQDPDNIYVIAKDNNFFLRFKTINGADNVGTYSYRLYAVSYGEGNVSNKRLIKDWTDGNFFNREIQVSISLSDYFDEVDNESTYHSIEIDAYASGTTTTAYSYIRITEPTTARLNAYMGELNRYLIFDYTADGGVITNNTFLDVPEFNIEYTNPEYKGVYNSVQPYKFGLKFKNKGVDSELINYYFSLNHRAFGTISMDYNYASSVNGKSRIFPMNGLDSDSLISGGNYKFTLDIAYSIGSEDDDRTIFRLGDINPDKTTVSGDGILIRAHKYYIRLENTYLSGDIQDQGFNHIVITFDGTGGGLISVFVNGVYHQVSSVANTTSELNWKLSSITQSFYLACGGTDEEDTTLPLEATNVNFYSVRFFSTTLNLGQVICSYINNYVCYKLDEYGKKRPKLVEDLLTKNSITSDAYMTYDTDGNPNISTVYDFHNGEYTWNLGNNLDLSGNILENLPIPTVTLQTSWTFDEFRSTSALNPDENCLFNYRDAGNEKQFIGTKQVKLEIQGTTTTQYEIKNLEITFQSGVYFSPKNTWFPENEFTLKADVVDSGHINNAVIGKFINDCYNSAYSGDLLNATSSAYPMKSEINSYLGTEIPSTLTPKITIEGFPVLLIINFNGEPRQTEIVGIYSFNLGRHSYDNLGLEMPIKLRKANSGVAATDAVFPGYYDASLHSDNYTAYCFEGISSFNNDIQYYSLASDIEPDFYDIKNQFWLPTTISQDGDGDIAVGTYKLQDKNGNPIKWNSTNVKKAKIIPNGYFWSDHVSYRQQLWEKKFSGETLHGLDDQSDNNFSLLCDFIATRMEYSKGTFGIGYGSNIPRWKITQVTVSSDYTDSVTTQNTGEEFTIERAGTEDEIPLSVKNTAFYYVICMLFGLVDSLGKNLQFKAWKPKNSALHFYWSPSFYDMDTALGLDNAGGETVLPTALDYSVLNDPSSTFISMFGQAPQSTNGIYTVFSNKLWGAIESESFVQYYNLDYESSYSGYRFYSKMWNDLRKSLLRDVDTFVDTYFETQIENCSHFLINYDYVVKYVRTSQKKMLHGTRINFIRNWLKERVVFLDSIFGLDTSGNSITDSYLRDINLNMYEVPYLSKTNFQHNSGCYRIPITTSKSVVIESTIGASVHTSTYVPKNTPTEVWFSNSLNTPTIQTVINNSSCIKKIDELIGLSLQVITGQTVGKVLNMSGNANYSNNVPPEIQNQLGNLNELRELNLSGITTINSDINLFNIFKTWDTSPLGINPNYFRLEKLDYSNVRSNQQLTARPVGINYPSGGVIPSVYINGPFKNLIELDVSNSDVNSVSVPEGISLMKLNIKNSSIEELNLSQQPLLDNLNFEGCINLQTIRLVKCERFTAVNIDSTLESLKELSIDSCNNLVTITVDASYLNTQPKISIKNCPNLYSIVVRNYVGSDTSGKLEIENCGNLQIIDIQGSNIERIIIDTVSQEKIFNFRASSSTLKYFGNSNSTFVDFTEMGALDGTYGRPTITFANNKSVEIIKFKNEEDNPVEIVGSVFSTCTKLRRVYGNLAIYGNSSNGGAFARCTNLQLFPNNQIGNISVKNGNRWLHPTEIPSIIETDSNGKKWVKWISGDEVLNFRIYTDNQSNPATSGAAGLFRGDDDGTKGPNLSNFEMYYALMNIDSGIRSISSMFYQLADSSKDENDNTISRRRDFSWSSASVDNSPHRNMFMNCTGVTSAGTMFYGTTCAPSGSFCRAFSPTTNNNGQVTENNGLLSPLRNCTGNLWTILPVSFVCDKYLYRLNSGQFKLTELKNFNPSAIINDINSQSYSDVSSLRSKLRSSGTLSEAEIESVGDIDSMFKDCPNITSVDAAFSSAAGINFDSLIGDYDEDSISSKNFGLDKMTNVKYFFNECLGCFGNFELNNLFTSAQARNKLTTITESFSFTDPIKLLPELAEEAETKYVKFELRDDTFAGFGALKIISYTYSSDESSYSTGLSHGSFYGSGMYKFIRYNEQSSTVNNRMYLPNILSKGVDTDQYKSDWTQVNGLFRDCRVLDQRDQIFKGAVKIPGDGDSSIFKGCSNLTNIYAFFYNFLADIELTSESFAGCTKLSNVRYLFAKAAKSLNNRYSCSPIPLKLFFTGEDEVSIEIKGTNREDNLTVTFTNDSQPKPYISSDLGPINRSDLSSTLVGASVPGNLALDVYYVRKEVIFTGNYDIIDNSTILAKPNSQLKYTYRLYSDQGYTTFIATASSNNKWYSDHANISPTTYSNHNDGRYHYIDPKKSITRMEGCFSNLNIKRYFTNTNYSSDPQNCPEYFPYKYKYLGESANKWQEVTPNYSRYTWMWEYDGRAEEYADFISSKTSLLQSNEEFEYLDEIRFISTGEYDQGGNIIGDYVSVYDSNNTVTPTGLNNFRAFYLDANNDHNSKAEKEEFTNFCTPPDLLRYSSADTKISSLFSGCGTIHTTPQGHYRASGNNNDYKQIYDEKGYASGVFGLVGRLCPYLLKPVSNCPSMRSVFNECKWLGYYTENIVQSGSTTRNSYVIPKTFFSYIQRSSLDLYGMFRGIAIPTTINLNVFTFSSFNLNYESIRLELERVFSDVKVLLRESNETTASGYPDKALIKYVFTDNRCAYGSLNEAFYNEFTFDYETIQNIKFDTVFLKSKAKNKGKRIFAGYASSSVVHEPNPTVSQTKLDYNYQNSGDTNYNGYYP